MEKGSEGERRYVHITKGCFGCGTENPAGLGLKPYHDSDGLIAEFTPKPQHRGFTAVVHGGIIASVLDEVITSAAAVKIDALVATVAMEVQFLSAMKLEGTYLVRGRYTGEKDKTHTAEGEITDSEGRLIARGRGKFLPLTPGRVERFLSNG
ncbi:MAG: PaaI family thioesterase [Nitrospirae bacterium]|nr:PaaI family thioesterase [Nitrospirota bacterium]